MDPWERTDEIIDRIEQTFLVVLLSTMILIAFSQILLRNLFATGLAWGDPLVRNLVLWVGFIGAALATKEGKHINIDVFSRWLPSLGKTIVGVINHLFSFLVCCLLCFAALKFVKNEAQMGSITFSRIPAWIPQIILPITFGVMAFRYGLRFLRNLLLIVKVKSMHTEEEEI
jgi:C4-dicarboxylate transporter DctQ subunit